jgi:hypothetical protein
VVADAVAVAMAVVVTAYGGHMAAAAVAGRRLTYSAALALIAAIVVWSTRLYIPGT